MNILDEDISVVERERLRARKIHIRQIGIEIGRLGMKDRTGIIPLLHTLHSPTFFTRDHGFYHPRLLHPGYCLVHLDVVFDEVAEYTHRFLRHQAFRTRTQRLGKIVRVRHSGTSYWEVHQRGEHALISWSLSQPKPALPFTLSLLLPSTFSLKPPACFSYSSFFHRHCNTQCLPVGSCCGTRKPTRARQDFLWLHQPSNSKSCGLVSKK